MGDKDVTPERPRDAGLPEDEPDVTQVEPVHLLANDARDRLQMQGFTDDQIDRWAATYVGEVGQSATVDEFISWIAAKEHV